MPEGTETVSRPSPDYPMLPTIPLSAFSDPKKAKPSSHPSKVCVLAILVKSIIADLLPPPKSLL